MRDALVSVTATEGGVGDRHPALGCVESLEQGRVGVKPAVPDAVFPAFAVLRLHGVKLLRAGEQDFRPAVHGADSTPDFDFLADKARQAAYASRFWSRLTKAKWHSLAESLGEQISSMRVPSGRLISR